MLDCRLLPLHLQGVPIGSHLSAYAASWFVCYVMVPFALIVGAFMLSTMVWGASDAILTIAFHSASSFMLVLILCPALAVLFICVYYASARCRYLRLHKRGLAGRWPFPWNRFAVRYEDIDHVLVGKEATRLSRATDAYFSIVNPGLEELRRFAFANSILLVLRDATHVNLGYIFASFEPADAVRFVELLVQIGSDPRFGIGLLEK